MNSEGTIVSEISQSQRTNTVRFLSFEVPRIVKFVETESRIVAAKSWGEGVGVKCLMGTKPLGKMKKFWVVTQQCECAYPHRPHT